MEKDAWNKPWSARQKAGSGTVTHGQGEGYDPGRRAGTQGFLGWQFDLEVSALAVSLLWWHHLYFPVAFMDVALNNLHPMRPLDLSLTRTIDHSGFLIQAKHPTYQHLQKALPFMSLSMVEISHALVSPLTFHIVSYKASCSGKNRKMSEELWLFTSFLLH